MKNSKKPLISVIMPVYNAGDFLVEAIESIRWQTYKNWEMICIDDGSTDKSFKILKDFTKKDKRIKVIHSSENQGLAAALNKGLEKAKGAFIARMDADDISLPERFVKQLEFLLKNPRVIAVGSQSELIDEKGDFLGYKKFPCDSQKLYKMMLEMVSIQHPTLMTYAKIMKKYKYENHQTAEDVSMFFKLLQNGDFGNTEEVLFQYRIRKNSNSLKDPKKTFFLTLKSRIKAVRKWGYKPNLKGILVNLAQLFLITVLPKEAILNLYEFLRFRKLGANFSSAKTLRPALIKER